VASSESERKPPELTHKDNSSEDSSSNKSTVCTLNEMEFHSFVLTLPFQTPPGSPAKGKMCPKSKAQSEKDSESKSEVCLYAQCNADELN
jgi:hypothetical protein